MARTYAVLVLMGLLMASLGAPDVGSAGTASSLRVEAEAMEPKCPGDYFTSVIPGALYSGGAMRQFWKNCAETSMLITVEYPIKEFWLFAGPSAYSGECPRWGVWFDTGPGYDIEGTTRYHCQSESWTYLHAPLTLGGNPVVLPPGTYRMFVQTHGAYYNTGARFDFVDLGPDAPGCPTNRHPEVAPEVSDDGLGPTGGHGWTNFNYTFGFDPRQFDPEQDPLVWSWLWPDGSSEAGGLWKSRTMGGAGIFGFRTYSVDDPSSRNVPGCPGLLPKPLWLDQTFEVIPFFAPAQTRPLTGDVCVEDQIGSVARLFPVVSMGVIAGKCTVQAHGGTAKAELVERVDFVRSMQVVIASSTEVYASSSSAPHAAVFDGLAHSAGVHALRVCSVAVNDKHHLAFCSPTHQFLNAGLGEPLS